MVRRLACVCGLAAVLATTGAMAWVAATGDAGAAVRDERLAYVSERGLVLRDAWTDVAACPAAP
jgi:hypothetical protein